MLFQFPSKREVFATDYLTRRRVCRLIFFVFQFPSKREVFATQPAFTALETAMPNAERFNSPLNGKSLRRRHL